MRHFSIYLLLIVGTCLLFPVRLSARKAGNLHLIPFPKEVILQDDHFTLDPVTKIGIEKTAGSETLFAAGNLMEELDSIPGFSSSIIRGKLKKAKILLGIIGRDVKITELVRVMNLNLPTEATDESYILSAGSERIIVAAHTEAGLFYGVQTLRQLLRSNRNSENQVQCLIIKDWPSLRYRGWMDDISRGPVPTVNFLKQCIRTMAEYKQNFFTLYTENVFSLEKYPDLAPPGSLTKAEVEELSLYAASYHIDMIGNFQSFGHMEKILGNPFYAALRESGNILNPADENTYKFLADIYSEVVPSYKSRFFNINCDETQGLGEGKSREMVKALGTGGVYAYHINRINSLMKPYGKRLMMWGDIAVDNPQIIEKLPKDLIILSWGYHAADSFDDAILPFKKTGFDFLVAPGVGCWNELWPALSNASININNYVRDGAKLGAMGMMNTAWDDNGHNLFNYNWHGLVWGAECSWNPAPPSSGEQAVKERNQKLYGFNRHFDELFFGLPGVTEALFAIDSLRSGPVKGILGEGEFWKDILTFYPDIVSEEAGDNNMALSEKIDRLAERIKILKLQAGRNAGLLDHALFALQRARFSTQKNLARILLNMVYESGEAISIEVAEQELANLKKSLYEIKKNYIRLWNQENRPWWLDKNLNDYNRLAQSFDEVENTVFIKPGSTLSDGILPVELFTLFHDKTIVYTTDGTQPKTVSVKYTNPLRISSGTLIKASVLNEQGLGKISEKEVLVHKGIGKIIRLNSEFSTYNPAYAAGGSNALADGLCGSISFADGRWQGFQGQDVDVEFDMGVNTPINSLQVNFLQSSYSWILLPNEVVFLASDDGLNYHQVALISHDIPQQDQKTMIHPFKVTFPGLETRYLRMVAHNPGVLPPWHHAAGNPCFLFADEIIIK